MTTWDLSLVVGLNCAKLQERPRDTLKQRMERMDSGGEPMRLNIKSPNIVTSVDYMTQAEALELLSELSPLCWAPCPEWLERG